MKHPARASHVGGKISEKRIVKFSDTPLEGIPDTAITIPKPGQNAGICASGDLEQIRNELVLDKLAKSLQKTFANQLQWWTLFCQVKGGDPLWRDNSPSLERENLVLDYIAHSGVVTQKAPGTVKVRLAAIRSHHLSLGLPDPFYHMSRVAMALAT